MRHYLLPILCLLCLYCCRLEAQKASPKALPDAGEKGISADFIQNLDTRTVAGDTMTLKPWECYPFGVECSDTFTLDSLYAAYPNCTRIVGHLTLEGDYCNPASAEKITSVGSNVNIRGAVGGLHGLGLLDSIGGDLLIKDTDLTNLQGLEHLSYIEGAVRIRTNPDLQSLEGFPDLDKINKTLWLEGNRQLKTLEHLEGIEVIMNNLHIQDTGLTSFDGLGNLREIEGFVNIYGNDSIQSLSGLEGLERINKSMFLGSNLSLESVNGVESLLEIGKYLHLYDNWILEDLDGFSNLQSIGGPLELVRNLNLKSIAGIENLDLSEANGLRIYRNETLSVCEVGSICQWVEENQDLASISENSSGCLSLYELSLNCGLFGLDNKLLSVEEVDLLLFPNPADDQMIVQATMDGSGILRVYDQCGRVVLEQEFPDQVQQVRLDLSGLLSGPYFLQIHNEVHSLGKRFIVAH